nr:protein DETOXIFICATION 53-like [Tanacetum cinerariifolium]
NIVINDLEQIQNKDFANNNVSGITQVHFLHHLLRSIPVNKVVEEVRLIGKAACPVATTTFLMFSKSIISMLFLSHMGKIELAGGALAIGFANITGLSIMKGLCMGMDPICFQAFGAKSGLLENPQSCVAATGIIMQTTGVIYVIPFSLSLSISQRVGNELGAGQPSSARWAAIIGISIAFIYGLIVFGLSVTLRNTLGKLYTNEVQILGLLSSALPITGLAELGNAPQTAACGALTGSARPKVGVRINIAAFYLIGLPMSIVLAFVFKIGYRGLWLGLVASQAACVSLMVYTLVKTDWSDQAKRAEEMTLAMDKDDETELNELVIYFKEEITKHSSETIKFNTIITSLKALDDFFSNRNHVKKFLRALPSKWRPNVTATEESKDLSKLSLDELVSNLKVYEVVLEKDSESVKNKKEKYKSLALKARHVLSDEDASSSDSNDEEYAMAIRDFKKFFRRRGKFVRQPYNDKKNFRKAKEDKKEDRSDCGDDKEEICLMAHQNEVRQKVKLEPNEWIKDSGCSRHMTGYSPNSKAYIVLNKETIKVEEYLNVKFDETPPPKSSPLVDDDILENDIIENQDKDLEIKENEPEAIQDESWTMGTQEELNQFKTNDVWSLVPPPRNQTIIGLNSCLSLHHHPSPTMPKENKTNLKRTARISIRPCCFNNPRTSSPLYQPFSPPSDYVSEPPPTTSTSQTSIPHLSPTSNNNNILLTPKITPPPLTSPPPAPTQPFNLSSPLAINLDPIELLFSTPPTYPQAFLDSIEDLLPATTNPPPPRPLFDTIEHLANEPPLISYFPSPTPDMKPPIPPFPPQCSPNLPSSFPPLPPLGPNNPIPMLTHEMFCEHCQRT